MSAHPNRPSPEPALERTMPSGAVAGTTIAVDHAQVEMLMSDGSWAYAEVLSESRDIRGRWRVKLLWYGTDSEGHRSQREDIFMFDPARLRRLPD